jgi:hypothetical protein
MKLIKYLLFILLFSIITINGYSQCNGTTSFNLTPSPPPGGYLPGTIVTVCFTMNGYTQVGSNWFEGFDINLGPGWTSLTPISAPANCGGSSTGGQWIWMTSVTSVATPVITIGPGYFFDLNNDGNPGNDFGDNNVASCSWTMCFNVTVSNSCTPQNLLIQVTLGSDGVWGSYTSTSCDLTTPINIYNGNSNPTPITIGPISHN